MHQNVARCRDDDVSRVSLRYDNGECSPGLLSMEWYPSSIVPGRHRMVTSVVEHGMVPHAGTHVLPRHMAPSLNHFLFLWKTFLLPCFFAFSGVQAALWRMQPCNESKRRGCADNYTVYAI